MARKPKSDSAGEDPDEEISRRIDEHNREQAKQAKPLKGARHTYTTGLVVMDYFINPVHPGIQGGSIIQFAGEGNAGKTAHALNICKYHMAQGYKVTYIDQENGLKDEFVEGFGWLKESQPELFQYVKPVKPDQVHTLFSLVFDILTALQGNPTPRIIVIDSVSYMRPAPNFEVPRMGDNIAFFNNFLKAVVPIIGNTNALLILLNGVYQDNKNQYNDYIIPGGITLNRACDLITIHYKRTNPNGAGANEAHSYDVNKNFSITTRQKLAVKIHKNKWTNSNPKFSTLEHFLNTDKRLGLYGMDNANSMLNFLKQMGILKTTLPTYTLDGVSMYWKKWEQAVNEDPEINSLVLRKTVKALQDMFINDISEE